MYGAYGIPPCEPICNMKCDRSNGIPNHDY